MIDRRRCNKNLAYCWLSAICWLASEIGQHLMQL